MIALNCAALPDSLLESELFGYEAGAFTDAKKDKPGRLALAEGGTLFLDEIGDVSPALQVRLLRVLQEKTYEPLGGTTSRRADVRIVAATNRELEELVREGRFRQDLYYRINVIKLRLPPLRSRKEDIPLLVEFFIKKFNRLSGKEIQGLSPEVLPILMAHHFPGNIRELENIIEYATVVCKSGFIGLEHLPEYLFPRKWRARDNRSQKTFDPDMSFEDMERSFILTALREKNWSRKETAQRLGMHPSTLWRKMIKLKIDAPHQRGKRDFPKAE